MRGTLLPAARALSATANAQVTAASGQATGLPLAAVLLVVAAIARLRAVPDAAVAVPAHPPAGSTPAW